MKLLTVILSCCAFGMVAACGVKSSGVRALGPDIYTISVDDLKDTTAKGIALGLAESHCTAQDKAFLVTHMHKRHQVRYYYDVTFLCLASGDPRLQNPQYETTSSN